MKVPKAAAVAGEPFAEPSRNRPLARSSFGVLLSWVFTISRGGRAMRGQAAPWSQNLPRQPADNGSDVISRGYVDDRIAGDTSRLITEPVVAFRRSPPLVSCSPSRKKRRPTYPLLKTPGDRSTTVNAGFAINERAPMLTRFRVKTPNSSARHALVLALSVVALQLVAASEAIGTPIRSATSATLPAPRELPTAITVPPAQTKTPSPTLSPNREVPTAITVLSIERSAPSATISPNGAIPAAEFRRLEVNVVPAIVVEQNTIHSMNEYLRISGETTTNYVYYIHLYVSDSISFYNSNGSKVSIHPGAYMPVDPERIGATLFSASGPGRMRFEIHNRWKPAPISEPYKSEINVFTLDMDVAMSSPPSPSSTATTVSSPPTAGSTPGATTTTTGLQPTTSSPQPTTTQIVSIGTSPTTVPVGKKPSTGRIPCPKANNRPKCSRR